MAAILRLQKFGSFWNSKHSFSSPRTCSPGINQILTNALQTATTALVPIVSVSTSLAALAVAEMVFPVLAECQLAVVSLNPNSCVHPCISAIFYLFCWGELSSVVDFYSKFTGVYGGGETLV